MVERHKYKIFQLPVGYILFKTLMKNDVIDTRETSTVMRNNFSSFDTYMYTVNLDVSKFNQ